MVDAPDAGQSQLGYASGARGLPGTALPCSHALALAVAPGLGLSRMRIGIITSLSRPGQQLLLNDWLSVREHLIRRLSIIGLWRVILGLGCLALPRLRLALQQEKRGSRNEEKI